MTVRKAAYHHGDLRAALLRATTALVKRKGPEAVTMRAVAAKAGVSEAAPYHHFADKRELLAAAAAEGFRALGAAMADAPPGLVGLGEAWVRFALAERGYYRLILGAHVAELDLAANPETRAAGVATRERVLARIAEELPGEDARRVFHLLWAQLHGTASLFLERELGADVTEADAIAMAREGVERLVSSYRP